MAVPGQQKQIKSQIGNAFPPIMAKAVGLAIHAALENVEFDYERMLSEQFETPDAPRKTERVSWRYPDGRIRLNVDAREMPSFEHQFFGEIGYGEYEDIIVGPGEFKVRAVAD